MWWLGYDFNHHGAHKCFLASLRSGWSLDSSCGHGQKGYERSRKTQLWQHIPKIEYRQHPNNVFLGLAPWHSDPPAPIDPMAPKIYTSWHPPCLTSIVWLLLARPEEIWKFTKTLIQFTRLNQRQLETATGSTSSSSSSLWADILQPPWEKGGEERCRAQCRVCYDAMWKSVVVWYCSQCTLHIDRKSGIGSQALALFRNHKTLVIETRAKERERERKKSVVGQNLWTSFGLFWIAVESQGFES
jgi:hypothetical protein